MLFRIPKNIFVVLPFFMALIFISSPIMAQTAILDDLNSQGVKVAVLDSTQLHQQRAKGLNTYLNLRDGGAVNFYMVTLGSQILVGTKMEKFVTGVAEEKATTSTFNIYYDNSTKQELWKHNTSTNAVENAFTSPVIHWADYRADGGFTYLSAYGQLFRINKSSGPGSYATHYLYK